MVGSVSSMVDLWHNGKHHNINTFLGTFLLCCSCIFLNTVRKQAVVPVSQATNEGGAVYSSTHRVMVGSLVGVIVLLSLLQTMGPIQFGLVSILFGIFLLRKFLHLPRKGEREDSGMGKDAVKPYSPPGSGISPRYAAPSKRRTGTPNTSRTRRHRPPTLVFDSDSSTYCMARGVGHFSHCHDVTGDGMNISDGVTGHGMNTSHGVTVDGINTSDCVTGDGVNISDGGTVDGINTSDCVTGDGVNISDGGTGHGMNISDGVTVTGDGMDISDEVCTQAVGTQTDDERDDVNKTMDTGMMTSSTQVCSKAGNTSHRPHSISRAVGTVTKGVSRKKLRRAQKMLEEVEMKTQTEKQAKTREWYLSINRYRDKLLKLLQLSNEKNKLSGYVSTFRLASQKDVEVIALRVRSLRENLDAELLENEKHSNSIKAKTTVLKTLSPFIGCVTGALDSSYNNNEIS